MVPGTQRTDVATLLALLATPGPGKPGVMTATTEDELSKNTHFEANRTLCRHLSDPRTLRWKTLLFRWKWVGSSGLTEMPPGALYTEAFVKMGLKIDRMGKSACRDPRHVHSEPARPTRSLALAPAPLLFIYFLP